jgi:hypothetical protein
MDIGGANSVNDGAPPSEAKRRFEADTENRAARERQQMALPIAILLLLFGDGPAVVFLASGGLSSLFH